MVNGQTSTLITYVALPSSGINANSPWTYRLNEPMDESMEKDRLTPWDLKNEAVWPWEAGKVLPPPETG